MTQKRQPYKLPSLLSHLGVSNSRPTRYECVALPAELRWPISAAKVYQTAIFSKYSYMQVSFKIATPYPNCFILIAESALRTIVSSIQPLFPAKGLIAAVSHSIS